MAELLQPCLAGGPVGCGQHELMVQLGKLARLDADALLAVRPGPGAERLELRFRAGELGARKLALLGQQAACTAALLLFSGKLMRLVEFGQGVGHPGSLRSVPRAVGHRDHVARALPATRKPVEEPANNIRSAPPPALPSARHR